MPATTRRPPHAERARDPWLDNARFVLIVLVLFGHAIEPLLGRSPVLAWLYRFIYLFHMPAFALLSGAVARPSLDAASGRAIAFRLLLPYLVFQALYGLAARAPGWPDAGPAGVATPYWLLWYLVSLAGWRLLLPLFARLRHPLLLAGALALAAGLADDVGYYLSLSRTLVLFPMFLIGWRHADRWRVLAGQPVLRLASIGMLLLLLGLAGSVRLDTQWLYGSQGYAALDAPALVGIGWRCLQLAAGIGGSLALLALVPRRPTAMSRPGQHSLPAYLLHGLLVKGAVALGFYGLLRALMPSAPMLATVLGTLSVAGAWLLCRPATTRLLAPVTHPRWLERRLWKAPPERQPG